MRPFFKAKKHFQISFWGTLRPDRVQNRFLRSLNVVFYITGRQTPNTHTSILQAKRGALGGKISKGGGWPKNGNSINNIKPWQGMNISRLTYLYHKKKI